MRFTTARRQVTAMICFLTLFQLTGPAADAQQANPHAAIERFLDADTLLVGWADLTQIDAESVAEFARKLDDQASLPDLDQIESIRKAITQLGVTRVYIAPSLSTLVGGPQVVIIPVADGNADSVALLLQAIVEDDWTALVHEGIVLVGKTAPVKSLQESKGEPRPRLLAELRRIDASNGVVASVPSDAAQTVVGMLASQPDRQADSFSPLVKVGPHLLSVSISTEFPPTSSALRVIVDSESSAVQVAGVLNAWTTEQIGDKAAALRLKASGNELLRESTSAQESLAIMAALQDLLQSAPADVWNARSMNNLKHLALAMHNFHDVHGRFPAQALTDDSGKRLLSWRVLVLPYLDQANLYQRFHLDEPWDSDHNVKLLDEMPDVFLAPGEPKNAAEPGHTQYVAPITKDSLFGRPGSGVQIQNITDGTSNTLMVVETISENAVPWTKPVDLIVGNDDPLSEVAGPDREFRACMCDGSAQRLPNGVPAEVLNKLVSIDGGEKIDWKKIDR